jgi:hypothetical protein
MRGWDYEVGMRSEGSHAPPTLRHPFLALSSLHTPQTGGRSGLPVGWRTCAGDILPGPRNVTRLHPGRCAVRPN